MTSVTQITVELGTRTPVGMQVEIFLGIGGREFHLLSQVEPVRPLILGEGANISDARLNDPRSPALDTADLDKFPKYIRSEGDFIIGLTTVTVNPGANQRQFRPFFVIEGQPVGLLTLSNKSGKYCYLK